MHKTLIQCKILLSDENKMLLFLSRDFHDVPCMDAMTWISHIPHTTCYRAEGWKVCLLVLWVLINLLRECKEQGAQVHLSSILFENFVNEAKLYKMKFLVVRKFPMDFFCYKIEYSCPALPINFP